MSGKQLLGAVRLSDLTDETTSPERQKEQITGYAALHDDTVVYTAVDLNVSGSVSPFERSDLGPWLTDPAKVVQWDGIIVAKLDRLTRSLTHFDEFRDWCDRHGKTIISVGESIDLSTPHGRMFANLLAMFAQFERERMGERRKEAAARIAEQGGWDGGLIPFGKRAERAGNGWRLVIDEEYAGIIRRMADDVLAGRSLRDIARWLNAEGIPTSNDLSRMRYGRTKPRGAKWAPSSVRDILRNPALADDPAILDYSIWKHVEGVRDKGRGTRTSGPRASRMLLRIAYCGQCGGILYGKSNAKTRYYRCDNNNTPAGKLCDSRLIPADDLEEWVNSWIMEHSEWPNVVRRETKGQSYKVAIDKVERDIRALATAGLDDPEFEPKLAALRAERDQLLDLQSKQSRQARYETIIDGTVGKLWSTLDEQGKHRYLRERGVKLFAKREKDGFLAVIVEAGSLKEEIAAFTGLTTEQVIDIGWIPILAALRERGLPTDPAEIERLASSPDEIKRLAQLVKTRRQAT